MAVKTIKDYGFKTGFGDLFKESSAGVNELGISYMSEEDYITGIKTAGYIKPGIDTSSWALKRKAYQDNLKKQELEKQKKLQEQIDINEIESFKEEEIKPFNIEEQDKLNQSISRKLLSTSKYKLV